MPAVNLTTALQNEYATLFDSCQVRPERAREIDDTVTKMAKSQERYASVGDSVEYSLASRLDGLARRDLWGWSVRTRH